MSEIRVDTISEKTSSNGVAIDSVTLKDGGVTATAASTITVADNSDNLTLTSTDADASVGPNLKLFRDSSSPAADDLLGAISFAGEDAGGNDTEYALIDTVIGATTDGSENGRIRMKIQKAGTLSSGLDINADAIIINDDSKSIDFRVESDNNTHQLFVDASEDKVGINTSTPSATLEIHTENNVTALETQPIVNQTYYAALFRNSSGNDVGQIESTASSTTFATSSDYRLKENITYDFDATTRLKQLKPARFNFIIDETNTLQDGFIAHEVSSIVPEAISGEKDATYEDGKIKPQSIDQSKLVPLLVKTVQELEARIKTLEDN